MNLPLLCRRIDDGFADWSGAQSECPHADVEWSHGHGRISFACPAFPNPTSWVAAAAAVHVHDVDCDVGAFGQRVGDLVAKQAPGLVVRVPLGETFAF
jgi:hypothetical protein